MNEEAQAAGFEALLEYLRQHRGFDFTGYKRPTLLRRVRRRMQLAAAPGFEEYRDYLEVHPEEFAQLFNTILINVTSFFRDPEAWRVLAERAVPAILASKGESDQVRAWSAGCASGEEAYSIAILLAEAMGEEAFRRRVKVYATDVDEEALAQARLAVYGVKELEAVDEPLRSKYFEQAGARYVFRNDLRRSVIFGRHDLVQDAPISRLDLLVCRNTLMYFNAETQARILQRLHYALNGGPGSPGFLFLGRAEMMLTHGNLFSPVDLKARIFTKIASPAAPARARPAAKEDNGDLMEQPIRLTELAAEESSIARVMIDANGTLLHANRTARALFSINPKDLGRPLKDLELSYRPVELRGLIEQAYAERRAINRSGVERRFPSGEVQYLDVEVLPLYDRAKAPAGAAVTFQDTTRLHALQDELRRAKEEVQTTTEELQSSNEELETTNEELQSSNEELETTNEELQSTNEELETMNEELQSTNEELQTVNEELRQRTDELNQVNAFLESVLGSLGAGAVVVNQNLNVMMWNHRAEDLWGLRADEVQGKSLLNLDIGLPVAELRGVIRPCLSGESERTETVLPATNRRGKAIRCRIVCTPLLSAKQTREGVILTMEELAPQ